MIIEEPNSLEDVWEEDCKVEAFFEEIDGEKNITLSANRAGLISLAKLLLFIAKDEHDDYYHVHIDKYSGLEKSSNAGMIFQKCSFTTPPNR